MNIIKNLGVSITLLLLPMIGFATSSANVQISKTELESQINKGNILSDSFGSGNECITTKDKYNQEYSSYKRSECFLNDGKYYYFICQLSNSCVINVTPTTSTENQTVGTTTQDIPNKAKLDAFLSKVSQMRKELNNDTKYGKVLSQVEAQLKTLGEKYKVSSTVTQMVGYLGVGIQNIKSELTQTQYVDDFFCELIGNCSEQTPIQVSCPQYSPSQCVTGQTPYIKETQVLENGCRKPIFACKPVTTQSSSTSTTTSWSIKSQGKDTCTTLGGGNIGNDTRLKSAVCNVGDVVYQRTNCTQGDIDDKEIYSWTYYECMKSTEVNTNTISNIEYVNLVHGGGISACNQQIVDKFGTQKYSCKIGGGCSLSGEVPTASNPSANPNAAGVCIPKIDWDNAVPTSSTNTSCVAQTINGYTLPARVNGGVSVLTKTVSNNTYEQEFKCNSGTWETKGTEVLKTTTPTNPCGTNKKLIGSVCVTDTSIVNPDGNHTIGQGACTLSNATKIRYDGKSYIFTSSQGSTLGIGHTLNQCIERCDISYLGFKDLAYMNCYYEGQNVRTLPTGAINNIKSVVYDDFSICKSQSIDGYNLAQKSDGSVVVAEKTSGSLVYQQEYKCDSGEWKKRGSTTTSSSSTSNTFTQADVNAYITQVGITNYDVIAKAVLDYEKQGYKNVRQQVATALGTTISVVNDYVTNYQKGTSGTSTPTTTVKTFTQGEVNAFVQQAGSNYDTIAKAIIDYEKQGYKNVRQQVATALKISLADVNAYIADYQKRIK